MRHRDHGSAFSHLCLASPAFHRQAGLVPLHHPARRTLTWVKPAARNVRAAVAERLSVRQTRTSRGPFKPGKLGQSAIKLGNRNIARGRDMAERPSELVGSPHIDNGDCFAAVEPALEIARLDPCE